MIRAVFILAAFALGLTLPSGWIVPAGLALIVVGVATMRLAPIASGL